MMPVQDWIDAPERYSTVEVMVPLSDEQGGGFGRAQNPQTLRVASLKMTSRERFQAGLEATTAGHKYFADLPLPVSERDQLLHPEHGRVNVRSVIPYPEEGLAIMEVEEVREV